jgi:hypothetical protein
VALAVIARINAPAKCPAVASAQRVMVDCIGFLPWYVPVPVLGLGAAERASTRSSHGAPMIFARRAGQGELQ